MAFSLPGFVNEQEFFPDNYVQSELKDELKGKFASLDIAPLQAVGAKWVALRVELAGISDIEGRLAAQRTWASDLIAALGFAWQPWLQPSEDGTLVPIVAGNPQVWILEAVDPTNELADPLSLPVVRQQIPEPDPVIWTEDATFEDIISDHVFASAFPPRWVLLIHAGQLLVIDRSKWADRRLLRFEFDKVFSSEDSVRFLKALASREGGDQVDRLSEESHKKAAGISKSLKYSVREAIEILGNEVVHYLREVRKEKVYGVLDAEALSNECLRYLYRLLFLFYVEARPQLGYAPMQSDEYRTGYSLDSLRELCLTHLDTEDGRNGYFLDDSIKQLFSIVYNGFAPASQMAVGGGINYTFVMKPLQGDLFDDGRMKTIAGVKLRNFAIQRVLELLGYAMEKGKGRRRVNYRDLDINHLGAVYEGLLSYTGFFAEADLYEVKKADTKEVDMLDQAWFVPESEINQYKEEEKVYEPDTKRAKVFKKGTFVYRLNGRNRQKSASYYTPEVLTRCVVRYALKELLEGKSADDILNLTICEPALGSGAFLNEAINQLSDAYLERKQAESQEWISEDKLANERLKVKAFLADNRAFGVDKNPVAVELAEISLWLNTIYKDHTIPWFGSQFAVGNSLIGARRQFFRKSQIIASGQLWLDAAPEAVKRGHERPSDGIYHFLLPDEGMSNYNDRVVRAMCPREMAQLTQWRNSFMVEFDEVDAVTLVELSNALDRLWKRFAHEQKNVRRALAHILQVWGQSPKLEQTRPNTERQKAWERLLSSRREQPSTDYERVMFVMNYWCALWFWPVEHSNLLPSRQEFLSDLTRILQGSPSNSRTLKPVQGQMFSPEQASLTIHDEYGFVNLEALIESSDRLKVVEKIAKEQKFFHWELNFADIFVERGGFDLILGNPPWIKVEWNEGGVMGDVQPLLAIRKFSAEQLDKIRDNALATQSRLRDLYMAECREYQSSQKFLTAVQIAPQLDGKANTYKCFVLEACRISGPNGVIAFVQDEGIYDDPNGKALREYLYPKVRFRFQFENELNLFEGTNDHGRMRFEVVVYGPDNSCIQFDSISNVFWPKTIDESYSSVGAGQIPGIKTEHGDWEIAGHSLRVIHVGSDLLRLSCRVYGEDEADYRCGRLLSVHSRDLIPVLETFAGHPARLSAEVGNYCATVMWDENGRTQDGTLQRRTGFPSEPGELILSGPHFYVGNPLYKTPRAVCSANSHYDVIPLTRTDPQYIPRSNFVRGCELEKFRERIPRTPWDNTPVTDFYRAICRRQLNQSGERTLISSILQPGPTHVNTILGIAFSTSDRLLRFASLSQSLPFDFYVKTTGRADLYEPVIRGFPFPAVPQQIEVRVLMLNCLTLGFAGLWTSCWNPNCRLDSWTALDPRLPASKFSALHEQWNSATPVRIDYQRHQAQVEVDVLAAMVLGFSLNQLCNMYRVQFPVLASNEQETYYDRQGCIVFTASGGLPNIGLKRKEWEKVKQKKNGSIEQVVTDDTLPGGSRQRTVIYEAPFDKCDREEQYRAAWDEFKRRGVGE